MRGSIILLNGKMMWPAPVVQQPPIVEKKLSESDVKTAKVEENYLTKNLKIASLYAGGIGQRCSYEEN